MLSQRFCYTLFCCLYVYQLFYFLSGVFQIDFVKISFIFYPNVIVFLTVFAVSCKQCELQFDFFKNIIMSKNGNEFCSYFSIVNSICLLKWSRNRLFLSTWPCCKDVVNVS